MSMSIPCSVKADDDDDIDKLLTQYHHRLCSVYADDDDVASEVY